MREQNIQKRKEGIDPLKLCKLVSNTRKKKVRGDTNVKQHKTRRRLGCRRGHRRLAGLFERKRESGNKVHL